MFEPNTMSLLITALIAIESGGDINAVGDGGDAVGILQLHQCFVDDVNRILELAGCEIRFDYQARKNEADSRAMVQIWFGHYLEHWALERCVRYFNAGKNWAGDTAGQYWQKVRKAMFNDAASQPI